MILTKCTLHDDWEKEMYFDSSFPSSIVRMVACSIQAMCLRSRISKCTFSSVAERSIAATFLLFEPSRYIDGYFWVGGGRVGPLDLLGRFLLHTAFAPVLSRAAMLSRGYHTFVMLLSRCCFVLSFYTSNSV